MFLRIMIGTAALVLSTSAGYSDTISLRKSCKPWQQIPANATLKSPAAALLQCANDTGTWLSLQITCQTETAELELRYRPGYAIIPPVNENIPPNTRPLTASTEPQVDTVPADKPLTEKEMLSFDFSKLGVTYVVTYDFDAQNWMAREKEPLATLFRSLRSGRYVDVSLLPTGHTERIPLRGATKAIKPVVKSCRSAKKKLDAKRALQAQN